MTTPKPRFDLNGNLIDRISAPRYGPNHWKPSCVYRPRKSGTNSPRQPTGKKNLDGDRDNAHAA